MAATVNYFEIGSPNPQEAARFYGGVFGWEIGEPSPVGYRMVAGAAGGLWDTTEFGGASWAIFYVEVEDVRATVAQAEALGATVLMPPIDNGAIEFAHLADPSGQRFGVWRPKTPSDGA